MRLYAEGLRSGQIATHLRISPKTVDTHRLAVMKKLKLRGVADLTRLAIRTGSVSLEAVP